MKILLIATGILLLLFEEAEAQIFKKIGKSAKKAAERGVQKTVDRRTEQETADKTDGGFDAIFNKKKKKRNKKDKNNSEEREANNQSGESSAGGNTIVTGSQFFPDGSILYAENFGKDAKGDFPAGWETNSGGEVILINNQKALRFYPNGSFIVNTPALPENYAVEFDLVTEGLKYSNNLSAGRFQMYFSSEKTFKPGVYAQFEMGLWKGSSITDKIKVSNAGNNVAKINNNVPFDVNKKILNQTVHITALVNDSRLRVYINNDKAIDLPALIPKDAAKYIIFRLNETNMNDGHVIAVANLKITQEQQDARSQVEKDLIEKGAFSTSDILFASGSDKIQSSSSQILSEIGAALKNNPAMKFLVIGHTDSDGNNAANQTLSEKRAKAVKAYLETKFGISPANLMAVGQGESEPLADNHSAGGKAKNRRVEFRKL